MRHFCPLWPVDTVPASAATRTPIVKFPGFALTGRSMGESAAGPQQHSIPTVFAPFHAGTIFQLAGRESPPGVTLNFSNMTLLLPNVTYEGIYQSGFLDFFDIGQRARFCFTNSVLVLKSCNGYIPNIYHMWCCTARQCNILYTQQAIEDLGYDSIDDLEYIACFERQAKPDLEPEPPAEEATGETVAVGIRVADFSTLPQTLLQNVTANLEFSVPEIQLESSVTVLAAGDDSVPYGTYALSPAAVEQLELALDTELGLVPASAATPTLIVKFPGVSLRGESVLDTLSAQQLRRIPTVFAPFRAGTIFQVDGQDTPPGVTLNFSNMTLFMPDVIYEDIYTSGLMEYFQFGRSARVCFTNSVLVLKSCDGYIPNTYHMWCCTARQCNILYTQQAIEDLGYDSIDDLEYIACYSKEASGSQDLTNVAAAPDGGVPVLVGGPGSPVLGVGAPEAGVIESSIITYYRE
eukprot:jgi/Ulvmu1/5455/UM226_0003.1